MINSKNTKAFTLIELLVVIAIIAVLTAVIVVTLSGSRAKARDAKRIAHISQIQLALEQYFDRCRVYPSTFAIGASNGCSDDITLGSFISALPLDPTTGNAYRYAYRTVDKLDYVLGADLEIPTSASAGDPWSGSLPSDTWSFTTPPDNPVSFSCDGGDNYCVVPK